MTAIRPNAVANGTATSSSGATALPASSAGSLLDITNTGSATLHFAIGQSGETAAVTDAPVMPGVTIQYRRKPGDTHIATITAAGTAAFFVVAGE